MDNGSLTAAAVAVAAQLYISPIHEVSTPKVVVTYLTANTIIFLNLLASSHQFTNALARWTFLNLTFLLTAILSTLIRRLYLSPLSHFPGPKLAALSNLWRAIESFTGRLPRTILAIHEEYNSDIIRVGPNDISIRNVEAVEVVYRGKYPRGSFYETGALNGEFDVNTTRDYKLHTPWRRIWDKAFVSSEFKFYNPRVESHVAKLVDVIRNAKGSDMNCSKLLGNLVFDIMADLSFAHDAGMQDGTGDSAYMDFLHKYMSTVGVVGALRNLAQLLVYLPEPADVKAFRLRGEALLAKRQLLGTTRKDIFSHLLATDLTDGSSVTFTQAQLNSNANIVIVAGADTTSTTLTQTFRMLAKQPEIIKKLRKELDVCVEEGGLSIEKTRNLPYLNGVVNESLRVLHPVPMGVHAASPPSGLTIGNTFIPGNVQIVVPNIALMRDPRYFEKPDEYIPERWCKWTEGVKDRRAFIPFGYGVHACVGRQLALNELRAVIANVVWRWDIVLGEKYSEEAWDKAWKDHGLLQVGDLWVRFVPRG